MTADAAGSTSPRIFISYRRDDTAGHAGHLYADLAAQFGADNVFMDTETLEPGADFPERLRREIESCDVLIALIGKHWLRRNSPEPEDYVLLEIRSALDRSLRVIPALVQGARMPSLAQLPAGIGDLSHKNALEISNSRWRHDVETLVGTLQRHKRPDSATSPAATSSPRTGPVSLERKLVTVLFADVVGTTALVGASDPEDARALLSGYHEIAGDVIVTHGGTIEKVVGDAVMAVFGLPQAHGDDATRALDAAVSLRDRMRNEPRLADFAVRFGASTGEVVAPRDASGADYSLSGEAVTLAARLQQAAGVWDILCSERTARAGSSAYSFGPPVELSVTGMAAPVVGRPVLGPVTRQEPRAALVGREADLEQIEVAAKRCFLERRPALVSLIAPAGTGKTRLLEEFLDGLPRLAPGAVVAVTQCLPYGQQLTFYPLRQMLFQLSGIADQLPAQEVRPALARWLQEAGTENAQEVAGLLAATIGAGAETSDQAALFAAWRTAVEAAARKPLVLVFEDLHWSSDSLLDLVEFVMQPRGDAPVLMLALTRPELLDRRPTWGGGKRNYFALSLEPLTDKATAILVGQLLEGASPQVVERIVERSEGNPFYAGELVRALLESGNVETGLQTLPDTVQATVLARLDLLPSEERRVIQLGAVLGRTFRVSGISDLAPQLAGRAHELCDRLVERDLVRPSGGDAYTFRHILIREVAYGTLPRSERVNLHSSAGRYLEHRNQGHEDAFAELIAYHFREAAHLAQALGLERETVNGHKRAAVRWLGRAADLAAAAAATLEGARHLQAAIELADEQDLPELYGRLGDLEQLGEGSLSAYQRGLDYCRRLSRPPDQMLRMMVGILSVHFRGGGSLDTSPTPEYLVALRNEAAAIANQVSDELAVARYRCADSLFPLAQRIWARGPAETRWREPSDAEMTAAERNATWALDVAERRDDPILASRCLDALSYMAEIFRFDFQASREFSRRRVVFQNRLDLYERIDAHQMIAWSSSALGDLAAADEATTSALGIVQPGQLPRSLLTAIAVRCYVLQLQGRWDEVQALGRRAYQLWIDTDRGTAGYAWMGFEAAFEVARARDDQPALSEAREAVLGMVGPGFQFLREFERAYVDLDIEGLEKGLIQFEPMGDIHGMERCLAICTDLGGRLQPARVQRLAAFAERYGFQPMEMQARRSLGGRGNLQRAIAIGDEIGAAPYAARARCELSLITRDVGLFTEGMRVLESIGDLVQQGRYRRAAAASGMETV